MNPLPRLLLTLMISISLGGADANARVVLRSAKEARIDSSQQTSSGIPSWAVHIPEHSFVGISSPCKSVEEARQQAVESVNHNKTVFNIP